LPPADRALAQELSLEEKKKARPKTIKQQKRIVVLEEGGAKKEGFREQDFELKALLSKEKVRQNSQRWRESRGAAGEWAERTERERKFSAFI
jgi:hypothetical protein